MSRCYLIEILARVFARIAYTIILLLSHGNIYRKEGIFARIYIILRLIGKYIRIFSLRMENWNFNKMQKNIIIAENSLHKF